MAAMPCSAPSLMSGVSPSMCGMQLASCASKPSPQSSHGLPFPTVDDDESGAWSCGLRNGDMGSNAGHRPQEQRGSERDQMDFDLMVLPIPRIFVGLLRDTEDAYEPGGFAASGTGPDLELTDPGCCLKRVGRVGGSRMALSSEGLTEGEATWTVLIGRSGLSESASASLRRMRRRDTRDCGVRLGVGQQGANLRWYVGYDELSIGLHSEGGVWQRGAKFREQAMDRCSRTASFQAGDKVAVTVDLDARTLRYSINDKPVPGVYCVKGLREGVPVYLAVSLLWPGEEVTMVDEEIYE